MFVNLSLLLVSALLGLGKALPAVQPRAANDATPRNIIYVQTFKNSDGSQVSLLPLLNQNTQVTHVILAALHVNGNPGDINLNDNNPNSNYYDFLWPEVKQLQSAGIKVMMMMGGAAAGSYQRLASNVSRFSCSCSNVDLTVTVQRLLSTAPPDPAEPHYRRS
jgi:hypothetical protein